MAFRQVEEHVFTSVFALERSLFLIRAKCEIIVGDTSKQHPVRPHRTIALLAISTSAVAV